MAIEYLFCINTGRSGSLYLSELFKHFEDTASFHEPEPNMHSRMMRRYLDGKKELLQNSMPGKVEDIKRRKGENALYVETTQCFIRGFGWEITNYLDEKKVGVIILTRDKEKIVDSYQGANISPIAPNGWNWFINPRIRPQFLFVEIPRELRSGFTFYLNRIYNTFIWCFWRLKIISKMTPFQSPKLKVYERKLLEWYVDEHVERTKAFKAQFPNIPFFEVDINELNTQEGVQKMLNFFSIKQNQKESLKSAIGKKKNTLSELRANILAIKQ